MPSLRRLRLTGNGMVGLIGKLITSRRIDVKHFRVKKTGH
jgi:hypothetical protein